MDDNTAVLVENTNIKVYRFRTVYISPIVYIPNKLIKFKLKNIIYVFYFHLNIVSADKVKEGNLYLNLCKNIFKIYKNK